MARRRLRNLPTGTKEQSEGGNLCARASETEAFRSLGKKRSIFFFLLFIGGGKQRFGAYRHQLECSVYFIASIYLMSEKTMSFHANKLPRDNEVKLDNIYWILL